MSIGGSKSRSSQRSEQKAEQESEQRSSSNSKTNSESYSRALNAEEVGSYFDKLNSLSSGNLNAFAKGGNAYQGPSIDNVKALGGLGATRINSLIQDRDRINDNYNTDASLSIFQKLRAQQLNNNDANASLDAINKETEAAITQFITSNELEKTKSKRADLDLLAQIYFGGKGQKSGSKSSTSSSSSSYGKSKGKSSGSGSGSGSGSSFSLGFKK